MILLSLTLILAACGVPWGPNPSIDAVDPGLVCPQDGPAELVLLGSGFSPVVVDALGDDPRAVLPEVLLERRGPLPGGQDADSGHQTRLTASNGLVWVDDTELRLPVDVGLGLLPGVYDLSVQTPAGQLATATAGLAVAGPPEPTALEPDFVCQPADLSVVELRGEGLLVVDGQPPTVTVDGELAAVVGLLDCAPVPGAQGTEVCQGVEVDLSDLALDLGDASINVQNPPPAACESPISLALSVRTPPELEAALPDVVCADRAHIVLSGRGLPEGATVLVGGVPASSVEWRSSEELELTLDPGTPLGRHDLVLDGPGGCDAVLEDAVEVVEGSAIFFVDPPTLHDSLAAQVRVYVAGVTSSPALVWLEAPDGSLLDLDFAWDADQPGSLLASVPAGLEAGSYGVGVELEDGCAGLLPDGLNITDRVAVALDSIEPPFAWTFDHTAVELRTLDPIPDQLVGFDDLPTLFLDPVDAGVEAVSVRGVTWHDETRLTAVIPDGLTPGIYDVMVVNPDGDVGLLPAGLEVTESPPPVIDSLSPGTLPSSSDGSLTVRGRDFDDPVVAMRCLEGGVETDSAGVVHEWTFNRIEVTLPTSQHNSAVCTLRVTNASGAWARYAAFSITNPSQNLFPWREGSSMVEARRAPAVAAGRSTSVTRHVYALGGDDGTAAGAMQSTERAAVDLWGELGEWQLMSAELPVPLTLASLARVGDFLYLVGGDSGSGALSDVWRARILDPIATPHFDRLSLRSGGGLGEGTWIYRVAALFDPADPINPAGESLPGEPIPLRLPPGTTADVTLGWTRVDGAVGYRVYRTPGADTGSGSERWVADTTDSAWTDTGESADISRPPLQEGDLGAWAEMPPLTTAREGACLVVAPDPFPDPEVVYIYLAGGRDAQGDFLDSIEVLDITIASEDLQIPGSWTDAGLELSEARAECGAFVVDDSAHSVVGDSEAWIFFGGGLTERGAVGTLDAGFVSEHGQIEDWQTSKSLTPARAGFAAASASNFLYAFGGQHGSADPTGASGELQGGRMPELRNWNSLGTALSEPRYLAGSAQESAVLLVVGGATSKASATRTTDWTNY